MKKSFAAVCVAILAAVLACGAAFAGGPSIDKIQYKNNGSVLIKFAEQIVQSGGQSITVRDSNGRQVPAQIVKSSGRQMEIRMPQAKTNEKYTFEHPENPALNRLSHMLWTGKPCSRRHSSMKSTARGTMSAGRERNGGISNLT